MPDVRSGVTMNDCYAGLWCRCLILSSLVQHFAYLLAASLAKGLFILALICRCRLSGAARSGRVNIHVRRSEVDLKILTRKSSVSSYNTLRVSGIYAGGPGEIRLVTLFSGIWAMESPSSYISSPA